MSQAVTTESKVIEMEKDDILPVEQERTTTLSAMMGSDTMDSAMRVAELMANSKVTVPKHLQGQPGDCMAIVLQSMVWGMNPFVVAQKTHIVSGALGYEAQLVNAVVQSSGLITGTFKYEYEGDGNKLQCRVGAVLRGDSDYTFGEWLDISTVTVKNSPLWKTNPKQQLGYLQVKNWARAYTPGAILGVYSTDELEPLKAPPKQINEAPEPSYTDDRFDELYQEWSKAVAERKKTAGQLISFVVQTKVLSKEQIAKLDGLNSVKLKAVKKPAAEKSSESPVDAEAEAMAKLQSELPEGKRLNTETGEVEDIPSIDEAPY